MNNTIIASNQTTRLVSITLLYIFFLILPGDKLSFDISGFTFRVSTLLALILFWIILTTRKLSAINSIYLSFLCFFALSSFASYIFYPSSFRNLVFIAQGLFNLTLYPLITFYFCDLFGSYRVTRIYIVSAVIISLYAVMQVFASLFGVYDFFSDQVLPSGIVRAAAFTYEPSSLSIYLIFPLIYLLQRSILSIFFLQNTRTAFGISLISIFAASMLSTSSTTFLSLCLYLGFVVLLHGRLIYSRLFGSSLSVFIAISFLVAGYLYISLVLPDSFSKVTAILNPLNHHSTAERFDMSYNALHAFKDRPLLGYGFGGVAENLFSRHQAGSPYLILAPSRLSQPIVRDTFQPMTLSTEILSSLGLFGFIGITVFAFFLFKRSASLLNRLKYADKSSFIHIYSLLTSTIFMCLAMQLSQGFFRLYVIVPIAILFYSVTYCKPTFPSCSIQ